MNLSSNPVQQAPFSPLKSTKSNNISIFSSKILQIKEKCLPLHPQTKNNGAIAQLVEHRTENPCVPGSNPGGTTKKRQHAVTSFFVSLGFRLYDNKEHSLALWRGVGSETFILSSLLSAFLQHSACQSCDNLQQ